jgi:hypothetical protein
MVLVIRISHSASDVTTIYDYAKDIPKAEVERTLTERIAPGLTTGTPSISAFRTCDFIDCAEQATSACTLGRLDRSDVDPDSRCEHREFGRARASTTLAPVASHGRARTRTEQVRTGEGGVDRRKAGVLDERHEHADIEGNERFVPEAPLGGRARLRELARSGMKPSRSFQSLKRGFDNRGCRRGRGICRQSSCRWRACPTAREQNHGRQCGAKSTNDGHVACHERH